MDIAIPSTAKQLEAQKTLISYRNSMLGDTLHSTVAEIDPNTLRSESIEFVPSAGMKVLQVFGIRDEVVFALPCVLKHQPRLLGYYRMLMGISEKQFYTSASGLASFRIMEHSGIIGKHSNEDIADLCHAINSAMDDFLEEVNTDSLGKDLYELPIMTLGIYADGVWRNMIGQQAADHAFIALANGIAHSGKNSIIKTPDQGEYAFEFVNLDGERYKVMSSSDPDIQITREGPNPEKTLCIEIKGGQDVANVHNRAGEAEKSHQKAALDGWKEKWTVIYFKGLTADQREKMLTESPTTDDWFDINEVCSMSGDSYDKFVSRLSELLNLS